MAPAAVVNWLAKTVRELQGDVLRLKACNQLHHSVKGLSDIPISIFDALLEKEKEKEKEVFEFKPTPYFPPKKKQVRFLLPVSPRFPGVMQSYQADLARRQLREPCSAPSLPTPATSCCSTTASPPSRATADEEPDPRIEAARILMRSGCRSPSLASIDNFVEMTQFILRQRTASASSAPFVKRPTDWELLQFEALLERPSVGNREVPKHADLKKYIAELIEHEEDWVTRFVEEERKRQKHMWKMAALTSEELSKLRAEAR